MSKTDQIDIDKGTPSQRSFSNLLPTFSHVPKSKEGNRQQCFSMVGESSNSRPSLIFVPSSTPVPHLLKAALQGIYTAKAMAPHSSTLAWKIPWMEESGRLQSMGSLKVGHNWATSLSLFTFLHWRRKWQPTLVFLPGESQGWGNLVGCRLWGHTESDTTEAT